MGILIYANFTHILHNVKWCNNKFRYIFHNIVANHLYINFGLKKILKPQNVLVIEKKKNPIFFAYTYNFMSSPGVRGHSITFE